MGDCHSTHNSILVGGLGFRARQEAALRLEGRGHRVSMQVSMWCVFLLRVGRELAAGHSPNWCQDLCRAAFP